MVLAVEGFVHEEEEVDHPMRYLPLGRVYSSSTPRHVAPATPKKPRAAAAGGGGGGGGDKPVLVYYRRRRKKARLEERSPSPSPSRSSARQVANSTPAGSRRKNSLKYELLSLGSATAAWDGEGRRRLRRSAGEKRSSLSEPKRRRRGTRKEASPWTGKRWVELEIDGADPRAFAGLACKVFWPLDDDWYKGSVAGYNEVTKQHSVKYHDGDTEDLTLINERIKFFISFEEMQCLNLKCGAPNLEKKGYNELLALAVSFHGCQDFDPGDIVWAKLTGHAMWPAAVVDESNICAYRGLKPVQVDQSILVQFFGTHDFARIKVKQAVPFLNGLLSSLHLKCKQARFYRSLDEAKEYLSTQHLPESMLRLQKSIGHITSGVASRDDEADSCDNVSQDGARQNSGDYVEMTPIEIGNLRVSNLGRIVSDSDHFHNKKHIWPEGFTALREFTSVKDPRLLTSYKMEVLRNSNIKARPLFRVTSDDGVQIDGPTPSACWKEIYSRIREKQCNGAHSELKGNIRQKSGSYMFGFSNPQIRQLIQVFSQIIVQSSFNEVTLSIHLNSSVS